MGKARVGTKALNPVGRIPHAVVCRLACPQETTPVCPNQRDGGPRRGVQQTTRPLPPAAHVRGSSPSLSLPCLPGSSRPSKSAAGLTGIALGLPSADRGDPGSGSQVTLHSSVLPVPGGRRTRGAEGARRAYRPGTLPCHRSLVAGLAVVPGEGDGSARRARVFPRGCVLAIGLRAGVPRRPECLCEPGWMYDAVPRNMALPVKPLAPEQTLAAMVTENAQDKPRQPCLPDPASRRTPPPTYIVMRCPSLVILPNPFCLAWRIPMQPTAEYST